MVDYVGQLAYRSHAGGFFGDNQRHAHGFRPVQQLYSKGYGREFASAVGVEPVIDYDYIGYFDFIDYHYVPTLWCHRKLVFECAECRRWNDPLQLGCEFRQFALRLDSGFQWDHQRHAQRFCTVQLYSKGYGLEFASPVGVEAVVDYDRIRGNRDSGGDCNAVRDVLYGRQ
jgi:hypothetical protein